MIKDFVKEKAYDRSKFIKYINYEDKLIETMRDICIKEIITLFSIAS
jgi:hypothetical protein